MWRPGLPANSELDRPAAARDSRPSQAQSSPRLPSPQPPLSQAGPKLWPGWTLVMEPQGLSPLLSAHVYSLAHVCLMILFRVTPQSGCGLRAILLRPLSLPRPWAPGLLIHHFTEQQRWEGNLCSFCCMLSGRVPSRACVCMCVCAYSCVYIHPCVCSCVHVYVY